MRLIVGRVPGTPVSAEAVALVHSGGGGGEVAHVVVDDDAHAVDPDNPALAHKTVDRTLYDRARARHRKSHRTGCARRRQAAAQASPASVLRAQGPRRAFPGVGTPGGPFDVLLVNTRGEVTESSIANVLVDRTGAGDWVTPPLSSGRTTRRVQARTPRVTA